MGFFKSHLTDAKAKKEGVKFYSGNDKTEWFHVARMGSENVEFRIAMESVGDAPKGDKDALVAYNKQVNKAIATTIIKGWGSDKHGEGKIEGEDGKALVFSEKSLIVLIDNADHLLDEVSLFARDHNNYLKSKVEADVKN